MGSGKSSVGKLLANKLQFSMIDIDKEIEKDEKLSIKEIFEKKGENYFREIESHLTRKYVFHKKIGQGVLTFLTEQTFFSRMKGIWNGLVINR